MRRLAILALVLAASGAAATHAGGLHRSVIVVGGNTITVDDRDGNPAWSPDGKRIVFERATGAAPLRGCAASSNAARAVELWTSDADRRNARRLLKLRADPDMKKTVCAFAQMQFSADGSLLYFETPAWATSDAIHVYDMRTGHERFLMPGNSLTVLARCKNARYRDHLVVSQHRYFVFGGSYDWAYLFSPDGKEIGPLGDGDFKQALEDACRLISRVRP